MRERYGWNSATLFYGIGAGGCLIQERYLMFLLLFSLGIGSIIFSWILEYLQKN